MGRNDWSRYLRLTIGGPLFAVLGLVALDVIALGLDGYGWVGTNRFETLCLLVSIDIAAALALLALLVSLVMARCPWSGLLAATAALMATVGLTAVTVCYGLLWILDSV